MEIPLPFAIKSTMTSEEWEPVQKELHTLGWTVSIGRLDDGPDTACQADFEKAAAAGKMVTVHAPYKDVVKATHYRLIPPQTVK